MAVWERSNVSREHLVQALQDWCERAENSGVRQLQDLSLRLRSYVRPSGRVDAPACLFRAARAGAATGFTLAGWWIGEWMKLQPCPLCIFQRLLYLLIAGVALAGLLLPGWRYLWGGLISLSAAGGLATAAYQSWLQYLPDASMACGFG